MIVAYPLRCTNWLFFHETFKRMDIKCRCIGLIADITAISARKPALSAAEIARSAEMIAEGYGKRAFNDFTVRTDEASFEETCRRLMQKAQQALNGN